MARTTANIDTALLEQARGILGSGGVTSTVNAALEAVVRHTHLASFDVRRFDVTDEDIAQARQERAGTGVAPA